MPSSSAASRLAVARSKLAHFVYEMGNGLLEGLTGEGKRLRRCVGGIAGGEPPGPPAGGDDDDDLVGDGDKQALCFRFRTPSHNLRLSPIPIVPLPCFIPRLRFTYYPGVVGFMLGHPIHCGQAGQ